MEIVAGAFIGILQNIFRSRASISFSKSKGRILSKMRVSFNKTKINLTVLFTLLLQNMMRVIKLGELKSDQIYFAK